jgi:hypothetical protein
MDQCRNKLFSRTGVRYEVVLDVIGACVAHFAEDIAAELEKPAPALVAIKLAKDAQSNLRQAREDLDPNDTEAVEDAIRRYTPMAGNCEAGSSARRLSCAKFYCIDRGA